MSQIYEELHEGTWFDYDDALETSNFDVAWQVLLHIALTADPTERPRVEAAAYSALAADSPQLVRGALEALSILMRRRYRVDRDRYERAKQTIKPDVAKNKLVQDELEEVESWWAEPNWWQTPESGSTRQ